MAVSFNGSSSRLSWTGQIVSSFPFSLFCWVKCDNTSISGMVVGSAKSTLSKELAIYADGAGAGSKCKVFSNDDGSVAGASTTALQTSWQPALAVFTSASSRTIYYAGGAAVTETTTNNALSAAHTTFRIGVRPRDDTVWFDGDIAEVACWSAALDQTDFDALAGGAAPETIEVANLIEHWELADASDLAGTVSRTLSAANVTTASTHPPVTRGTAPQGTVTITAVDPGSTSAEVTYGYDDTDEDSFQARIDGGTPFAIGASPATITGLSPATTYDLEIRAVNAFGNGAWSTPFEFTTDSLHGFALDTDPDCIFGEIVGSLTGIALEAENEDYIVRAYDPATGALIEESGTLSINSAGRLPRWEDPAFADATEYHLVFVRVADGKIACKAMTTT